MSEGGKPAVTIAYLHAVQLAAALGRGWRRSCCRPFAAELGSVALVPGTGGIFEIRVDGELVWERKRDGGFPDVKALKQRVRDVVSPERGLGHVDR